MADITIDGNVRVTWLTSLASTTSPSAATLEAGVDLEQFITGDGLEIELGDEEVDATALNSTFSAKKAGRGTVSVKCTFKHQGDSAVPWTTFASRPAGYIVVRRGVLPSTDAYAASQYVEVYSVVAGDRNKIAPAANELAKFSVSFFNSAAPVIHATTAA